MAQTLPGISTLETVGASLLALQRQLNLAPAPGLALTGDAWQVFANPLERLGALTPPPAETAAAPEEAAPEAPASSQPGAPPAQAAARPVRLYANPAQAASLTPPSGLTQPGGVSQPGSVMPPGPVWNSAQIQPQAAAGPTPQPPAGASAVSAGAGLPAGSAAQPQASAFDPGIRLAAATPGAARFASLGADLSALAAGPTGAASGTAAVQPARFAPQRADAPAQPPLPPLGSETRLVSKASGLAALLQANLQPAQAGQPGQAGPLGRLAPPASPDSVLAPGEWTAQAPESEFGPFPPAVEPAANPPGFDQTLPQPGSEPEAFQTWLDELELAYLRMYGTSGI